MSYEEKMMTTPGFSANTPPIADIDNLSEALSVNLSIEPPQVSTQQTGVSTQQIGFSYGPVAILWDIENCPVPSDVRPEDVAGNIRMALRVHPVIQGAVTMFSAYGDFNAFPRRLREGCQRTGVKLVDVPNGRKDAADKAILVDMFLFALDNRPPSSILLISGDVDFAPALHILGQRGYTIILVIPAGVGVSSALSNAGRFVWDWPSVARGEGFVPPSASISRGYDFAGYLMNCNVGSNFDNQNDEEAIVYKGVSQSDRSSPANLSQTYSSNVSRDFSSFSEYSYCNPTVYSCNPTAGNYFASSRTQSLPFSLNQGSGDQNNTHDKTYWVQPGDLQGLKGQLVRLVEMFGGSLPLVRVPAEYIKLAGRPLYMAEYGAHKLVNLINKMSDTFYLAGKGPRKLLCISNSTDKHIKKCPSTPVILKRDTKGKGHVENMDNGICTNMGSSSDDFSDDEKVANSDECLESFRMEMQELLVCYSRPIPLGSFVSLYEQRYKKLIDYQSFGVDGLEQLLEKARDVVELHEDQGTKRKFLVSTCGG